jgi:hypothetical protein
LEDEHSWIADKAMQVWEVTHIENVKDHGLRIEQLRGSVTRKFTTLHWISS